MIGTCFLKVALLGVPLRSIFQFLLCEEKQMHLLLTWLNNLNQDVGFKWEANFFFFSAFGGRKQIYFTHLLR